METVLLRFHNFGKVSLRLEWDLMKIHKKKLEITSIDNRSKRLFMLEILFRSWKTV